MKLMVKNRFVLVRAEIPLSCEYYHVCCSMCETQNLILASYYRNVSLQSCIIVFRCCCCYHYCCYNCSSLWLLVSWWKRLLLLSESLSLFLFLNNKDRKGGTSQNFHYRRNLNPRLFVRGTSLLFFSIIFYALPFDFWIWRHFCSSCCHCFWLSW